MTYPLVPPLADLKIEDHDSWPEPEQPELEPELLKISDEDIFYDWTNEPVEIVNIDPRLWAASRRELHIGGRTFQHVGVDHVGRWLYRADK